MISQFLKNERPTEESYGIIELLGHCKGGNLNIISGHGSAISSAKQGESGHIYNLVKNN